MLDGKSLLLTAGPTWEAIDPVRGITNHSSGKMGYSLARAARDLGVCVTLISGPVCLAPPGGVKTIQIQSALDMYNAVHRVLSTQAVDIFIGVAAVADYRPLEVHAQKLKKSTQELNLSLVKNPDIVASVAALKKHRPYTVGFAAETRDVEHYARSKLQAKNLDMIIANDVSEAGVGFGAEQNRIMMITQQQTLAPTKGEKTELSRTILQHISKQLRP